MSASFQLKMGLVFVRKFFQKEMIRCDNGIKLFVISMCVAEIRNFSDAAPKKHGFIAICVIYLKWHADNHHFQHAVRCPMRLEEVLKQSHYRVWFTLRHLKDTFKTQREVFVSSCRRGGSWRTLYLKKKFDQNAWILLIIVHKHISFRRSKKYVSKLFKAVLYSV